jgi:hypothetical protein
MHFEGWTNEKIPDWDTVFNEYETGEKAKIDTANKIKEREEKQEKEKKDKEWYAAKSAFELEKNEKQKIIDE